MRKLMLIVSSLMFVSAIVAAQHLNSDEPASKGNLKVLADVTLGTSVLKAGEYRYVCDRENITFSNPDNGKTVLTVPCEGRLLPEASAETMMQVKTDPSGKRVVTRLLLKGSPVEHVF